MKIKFFYDEVRYRLRNVRKKRTLIVKVIRSENMIPGDLNFIFTNNKSIKEINLEFLKHNRYTDVIAFDYSDDKIINGEIYISVETVRGNATNYKVSLEDEMLRVMIHGTLHLCGYKDKLSGQRSRMRDMENKWLKEYGLK